MIWFLVETQEKSLQHHCGIVGIFSKEPDNLPQKLFYSLFSLQHRGQESAGIAYQKQDHLVSYKDLGMVSAVLSRYLEEKRESSLGIGHVRYSTKGGNKIENAQPILVTCNKGEIALAHNGTISNSEILKNQLSSVGSIFQSTSDSELILHLIAASRKKDFTSALLETLSKLEGAFSLVMLHNQTLYAIRDPLGFRPLLLGEGNGLTIAASESCAMDILGIRNYRSIKPGVLYIINADGIGEIPFSAETRRSQCVFELIYFARPDSVIFDQSVHLARKTMGEALALEETCGGDIVVPVPDSGNSAALGFSQGIGLPLEFGLTRNHYAGRSFIMPTTARRELIVRMKLHPVRSAISGKRIFLIDDSLVRGTTSRIIVSMLRDAGAKEIHLRLTAPEIRHPCHFGIDIPTREELISNRMTPEEIAKEVGADSVRFLSINRLAECTQKPDSFCYACFTGNYPVTIK